MSKSIITLLAVISIGISLLKAPVPFEAISIEERASSVGLDVETFELFSSVVEAESDRNPTDIEGRVYIALTIWNRASEEHPEFGDTIEAVLTQPGQFSTVRGGRSCTNRTDLSDLAVIEAYNRIQNGEAPEVLFFNCCGFFSWREPFYNPNGGEAIGGNYFSL